MSTPTTQIHAGTSRVYLIIAILAALLTTATPTRAELLATMHAGVGIGTPTVLESAWPFLAYHIPGGPVLLAPLFEDYAGGSVYPVQVDISISLGDDPDFAVFSEMLTNGMDEFILIGAWTHGGPVGAGGGNELYDLDVDVPQYGPDLVGYHIDSIRLFGTVTMESPGQDLYGDGLWTDWAITGQVEFYGTYVPEPSMALMISVCSLIFLKDR